MYDVGECISGNCVEGFIYVDVTKTMRNGVGFRLKTSNMCWVKFVMRVKLCGFFLKPCWEREKGRWGSKLGRMIFF